jgi:hypothetical protein
LELRLFIGYLASISIFSDSGVPSQKEYEFKDRLDVGGGEVYLIQRLLVAVDDRVEFHHIFIFGPIGNVFGVCCLLQYLKNLDPPYDSSSFL